jgi:hypothetical protein
LLRSQVGNWLFSTSVAASAWRRSSIASSAAEAPPWLPHTTRIIMWLKRRLNINFMQFVQFSWKWVCVVWIPLQLTVVSPIIQLE